MKAAQLNMYGGQDAVVINEVPKPVLEDGKVVVEVHAAGINPFDVKLRGGYLKETSPLEFPKTMGFDLSGVVVEVGKETKEFEVGQSVYGQASFFGGSGSFAELALCKIDSLSLGPTKTTHQEAAALPLAGVSALQALTEHLNLRSGQKILIHGGAGGIGSYAIQLAKHLGAYVATTVTAAEMAYAKQLGADETVDYESVKFETVIKDFDAVYDTVGGDTHNRSYQVLKRGGTLVSMTESPKPELMEKYGVTALHQHTEVTHQRLFKLASLVDADAIKPKIDKAFTLDQAAEALEYLKNAHPRGKVIIAIKD